MIVVGLLGRAGSGKSTAGAYLEKRYGARRYSFAAPLKDITKHVFAFSEAQVRGTQADKEAVDKRYGISPREALIRLGDGARHILWDAIWLDACLKRIFADKPKLAVIDDVRYPNEARAVAGLIRDTPSSYDGYVIKLDYKDRESSVDVNAPSERSVDEVSVEDIFATVHHYWTKDQHALKQGLDAVMAKIL